MRRRRGSWSRRRVALLLLVALGPLASAGGCCSTDRATLPRATLPPGEPDGELERELARHNAIGLWRDMPGGVTILPTEDLSAILEVKDAWKAFARALKVVLNARPAPPPFADSADKESPQPTGGR